MKWEVSLDSHIHDSDDITVLETIADERMNQEELLATYQQEHQLRQRIASAVSGLNDKERFIVEKRITSDDPLTLQDIADHFQISRERVRQIEERTLSKLRMILAPEVAITN